MTAAVLHDLQAFGPERCNTLSPAEARQYTARFARRSSENFSVATRLLPRESRQHFVNIYAFCRWADDLADDPQIAGRSGDALTMLAWWKRELELAYADQPRHPVFVALTETIQNFDLPQQLFLDLIDAFEQDQEVTRYADMPELLAYCKRSADPVGRLLLRVMGVHNSEADTLSDYICTALQLTNFWQDVRRDAIERDRIYIPQAVADRNGLSLQTLVQLAKLEAAVSCESCSVGGMDRVGKPTGEMLTSYKTAIRELVEDAQQRFDAGKPLLAMIPKAFRVDVELFSRGGQAILQKIERQQYDTWTRRPRLSRIGKAALIGRALVGQGVSAIAGSER
jgi:squalene synthase HpnC